MIDNRHGIGYRYRHDRELRRGLSGPRRRFRGLVSPKVGGDVPAKRKWTAQRREAFLRHLRATGNVSSAAEAVGLARSGVYALRQADAGFRAAWDDAVEAALDDLEAELRRRAMEGTERPVFHKGETVGTIRNYSDSLAMFLLRSRRPQVYGGESGGREKGSAPGETAAQVRRRLEERLARMTPKEGD